jgi:hypothetical protein
MNGPLRFRLLGDDNDLSGEKIHDKYVTYLDFVDQQQFSPNDDLPKYFALGLFHDGPIDELRFSPDGLTLHMRVQARCLGEPWWAWFRCEFKDVVWFSMATERGDRLNDPLGDRPQLEYRYAEIDTLQEELAWYRKSYQSYLRQSKKSLHSLLIDLSPPPRMMGLVFTRVDVLPEEPLAWEWARASGKFPLELYEPGCSWWRDKRRKGKHKATPQSGQPRK